MANTWPWIWHSESCDVSGRQTGAREGAAVEGDSRAKRRSRQPVPTPPPAAGRPGWSAVPVRMVPLGPAAAPAVTGCNTAALDVQALKLTCPGPRSAQQLLGRSRPQTALNREGTQRARCSTRGGRPRRRVRGRGAERPARRSSSQRLQQRPGQQCSRSSRAPPRPGSCRSLSPRSCRLPGGNPGQAMGRQ